MSDNTLFTLTPSQQSAYDFVLHHSAARKLLVIRSDDGHGLTTVLKRLHSALGGKYVSIRDFVEVARTKHPLATDDALFDLLKPHLYLHETVLVDDFHLAAQIGEQHFHPRNRGLEAFVEAIVSYADELGRRLIIGTDQHLPEPLRKRATTRGFSCSTVADYAHLGNNFWGERAQAIDWDKVYRFAPYLEVCQIKSACQSMLEEAVEISTDSLIDYLDKHHLTSNVDLEEVDAVELSDLCGVDEIIESLEINIVLPLTDEDLARKYALSPKRGILLAGPPGTGKTTVGRALAHRLRGKFFLVDGTCISGTDCFYSEIDRTFQAAVHNSPAVIFIDDSDVIFESGREHGLYRYLLTKLDGLESESASHVCVILTAMDVGNIPPALVRSGRIELWLEMKLPDDAARRELITRLTAGQADLFETLAADQVVAATEGFSGADLKRMVADTRLMFASDIKFDRPTRPITELMLTAAATVKRYAEIYQAAESRAEARRTGRPAWFSPTSGFHKSD